MNYKVIDIIDNNLNLKEIIIKKLDIIEKLMYE